MCRLDRDKCKSVNILLGVEFVIDNETTKYIYICSVRVYMVAMRCFLLLLSCYYCCYCRFSSLFFPPIEMDGGTFAYCDVTRSASCWLQIGDFESVALKTRHSSAVLPFANLCV